MAELLRIRCPICGMHPTLEVLKQTAEEKPAEVRIFIQRYGGKVVAPPAEDKIYKKKGRGSAPGYMEFIEVTDKYPEQVKEMEDFFKGRIKLFEEQIAKK